MYHDMIIIVLSVYGRSKVENYGRRREKELRMKRGLKSRENRQIQGQEG